MATLVAATGGLTLQSRPAPALVASMRSNRAGSTLTPTCRPTKSSAPAGARSRPGTGARVSVTGAEPAHVGPVPKKMQRAKAWSFEVENIFRLQEAGYRDLLELQACGQPEPELWPSTRMIKKLRTKVSLGGGVVLLYYRERPECGPKDVPKVKLYSY
jgi:hypothetical protein